MKELARIKLYAPVDGTIFDLKNLKDGVFSEGMLGQGLYIEPTSNKFTSPIESGSLELVTDTKHAFYFTNADQVQILMHIGIDTVGLNGTPFKVKAKQNSSVNLKTTIVEADLELIEKNNLPKSTVIVLDTNNTPGWNFEIKKNNLQVKQGDEIGAWVFTGTHQVPDEFEFLNEKSSYQKTAEAIYYAVGGKPNFSKVFSCMTRLRLEISDQKKVDLDTIKKLSLVKGINWSGSQLQIIIGGEVYKVLDALNLFITNLDAPSDGSSIKVKRTFSKKLMGAVTGVIMPAIPLILASGLLMGIKAILVMTGVVTDMGIGTGPINTNVDVFSLFINILAESGLKLFGIYIGYNTCKYLGGNTILQLFIGLAISGATLGMSVTQWEFFSIGSFPIKVGIYTSSILPHIAAAIILYWTEKWIKSWIPTSIDIIFRPLLTMTITFAAVFFIVGPALFLLESGIGYVIGKLSLIPFGIGTALFALLWQPLVLTGMHVTVVVPISVANAQGFHSTLLIAMNIATFAQMGAAIGVICRTKNSQLRTASIAALPGALVGVTEPVIYGVNLPKFRPFIAAIIGAGVAGLVSGLLAVEARLPGGMGVFGFTTTLGEARLAPEILNGILVDASSKNVFIGAPNSITLNLILWFVVNGLGLGLPILFTVLVYKERPLENKAIDKTNKALLKYYSSSLKLPLAQAKEKINNNLTTINQYISKEDLEKIKNLEIQLVKLSKMEGKLENRRSSEEKQKQKLIGTLKKLLEKSEAQQNKTAINKYKEKFLAIKNSNIIPDLEKAIAEQNQNIETQLQWLANWQKDFLVIIDDLLNEVVLASKEGDFKNFRANYFNAIHSLDINYLINEKDETTFSKKDFKKNQKAKLAIQN